MKGRKEGCARGGVGDFWSRSHVRGNRRQLSCDDSDEEEVKQTKGVNGNSGELTRPQV